MVQSRHWPHIRKIVAGRIINGYTSNDLLLGIIYKYQRWEINVAGTGPIRALGIENVDLSSFISKVRNTYT